MSDTETNTGPRFEVLLVDDDENIQETVAVCLASLGNLATVAATDGTTARRMLREQAFDLVLLDLGLPDIDGFSLLEEIRNADATAELPVFLLTGRARVDEKVRAFELGAVDYLTKPFAAAELRARVNSVLTAKRLRDDLSLAREQAEAATAAKSEFLATMSHEIRTPMNGIIAMSSLLLESPLSAEQHEYAETIRNSGNNLLEIINDILDFSKIESGKLDLEEHSFELRQCVEDALDLLSAGAAQKGLELAYRIAPDVPAHLIGDATRVRQILVNLVANAVKFTEQGEVEVRVDLPETPRRRPKGPIPGSSRELTVHFSVRDTGDGIPSEKQGRLFQSFSQVDPSTARRHGGTGLGLAISRKLAELMGGAMWVNSGAASGSTFHFTISASPDEQSATAAPPVLRDRKVLLIEPNTTQADAIINKLATTGVQVITANADDAMDRLAAEKCDLALIDLHQTDGTGLTLARSLKSAPHIVLLTQKGFRVRDVPDLPANIRGAVSKPIRQGALWQTLAEALQPPAATSAPTPAPAESRLADRYPLRFLLAEDNLINQKVALRLLDQLGYQADVANNGQEALDAATHSAYDVVIMDVQMPVLDGLDATRRIRELENRLGPARSRPAVIIALTANAVSGDREKCLASGMDDYLAKPVRPQSLRETIEKWGEKIVSSPVGNDASGTVVPSNAEKEMSESPSTSAPDGPPPVDIEKLRDLGGGTDEGLMELVDLYLEQTAGQIEEIQSAITAGNADDVRRIAHSCAGANATCGMDGLVAPMRELERMGGDGDIAHAQSHLDQVRTEFTRVKDYLEQYRN